jgi:hypothetical protein
MAAASDPIVVSSETVETFNDPPFFDWRLTLLEYTTKDGTKRTIGMTILAKTLERAQECACRWVAQQITDAAQHPSPKHPLIRFLTDSDLTEKQLSATLGGLLLLPTVESNWTKKPLRVETGWFERREKSPTEEQKDK